MKFDLTQQEATTLINLLGQLPTNSGIYLVLVTLVEQYKAQEASPQMELPLE